MTAELEHIGSPRILVGTRADVQVKCYRDGVLTTPSGTLTLTATDADGDTVATATPTAASTGILTAALTAAQLANVGPLTLTWGGLVFGSDPAISLTTTVEVIGAWLFTLSEARAMPGLHGGAYSDDTIIARRDEIHDEFADVLGWRCGRMYFREVYDGPGESVLWLREMKCRAVRSVETRSTTTWTALTSGELAYVTLSENGALWTESGVWARGRQNIRVGYEAGVDQIPADLKRASLELLAWRLMNNNTTAQATAVNNTDGTKTLHKPGDPEYWTGLPSVDRVLGRHRRTLPGIG